MKRGLKLIVPAIVRRWWRQRFGWRWFEGDYASWADARTASLGYDDPAVLARVVAAARAVRSGAAVWDRDGVVFSEAAVHAPLLKTLREIAAHNGGRLDVVDFGGALGSTWWQHRAALSDLTVTWCVVEQAHFVRAGEEFSSCELSFAPSLAAACANFESGRPDLVLFSSVLQYVENPGEPLDEVVMLGSPHVIMDRTPFWTGGKNLIVVQRTPPSLGGGSYPMRIFNRASLLAPLEEYYDCVTEWAGFDEVDPRMKYTGLHFVRKGRA